MPYKGCKCRARFTDECLEEVESDSQYFVDEDETYDPTDNTVVCKVCLKELEESEDG